MRVARVLARMVYRQTMEGALKRHWGLSDQLRRAAISVPANVAEGYGQGTRPQFRRGLRIALGSAYEVRELVDLARDLGLVAGPDAERLLDPATRVIRLLVGLLRHLGAQVPRA
jgi:four helix bundle protein